MSITTFLIPPRLIFGRGSFSQLGLEAARLGRKALIVTGRHSAKSWGYLDQAVEILGEVDIASVVFAEVEQDPSLDTVERGAELAKSQGCDFVLGLGGGSPLDAAKAIAVLCTNPGPLRDYEKKDFESPGLPILCVPTTAGTASEVTRFMVLTDTVNKIKTSISSAYVVPQVAILDPLLTLSMPASVTAGTGMDALTHAIEAYVSKKAGLHTDWLAISAIEFISSSLIKAVTAPDNLDARERMLLGQMRAGLAFSNSSVGLVHAMSRPMGARFAVPHGLGNAMLLSKVVEFNRPACPERMADIARAMGERTEGLSLREASYLAVEALEKLFSETELPGKLSDLGIGPNDIPELTKDAAENASCLVNPRTPKRQDIAEIYRSLL